MKKLTGAMLLIFLAVSERLWFDLGPNVELIMVTSVLASMYLGKKWGVGVALVSLALSDMVLGNTMIMVFTWSAFGAIAVGGSWLKKVNGWKGVAMSGGYGLLSALFFYLYTNFGVWLISGMYAMTFSGLMRSYMMGLPFLKIHGMSSMLILSGSMIVIELMSFLKKELKMKLII